MRFLLWFDGMDRRILYLLVTLTLFVPLMWPIGLPVGLSDTTVQAYQAIERLQPGDIAILAPSFAPGTIAENLPQMVAFARHMMRRGVRIVGVSIWDTSPMWHDQVFNRWAPVYGYEHGRDFIVLPFIAGGESAVIAMGRDPFRVLFPVDFYGNSTEGTLLEDVRTIADIDIIVDLQTGDSLLWWIRQINAQFGTTITTGMTAVSVPGHMPYLASGQLTGLLSGMRGAAEYEVKANLPGTAAAGMDAQSLSHLLVMFFVIMGNLAYIARRRAR